jgi:adenine-specific DNA-methyltransferase
MDLNKEDGGNRKYICVQLPEPTDEKSEAYKAGYTTIAEISKERIRRASAKIKAEASTQTDLLTEDKTPLDLGFRVFKLQKSNFSVWDSTHTTDPTQIALQLEQHIDHITPEASQQAILFELLLKSGFELTTPIQTFTLAGKTVYSIADNALLICLEKELTIDLMNAIAALEPSRVIVLDEGFQNNDQLKTNSTLTLKAKGVNEFRTV